MVNNITDAPEVFIGQLVSRREDRNRYWSEGCKERNKFKHQSFHGIVVRLGELSPRNNPKRDHVTIDSIV